MNSRMIPDEAVRAACRALWHDGSGYDVPELWMRQAIRAAINEWPNAEDSLVYPRGVEAESMISAVTLPLTQKDATDEW